MVDVKGLSAPNWWLIQERAEPLLGLYYMLVLAPPPPNPPRFFILTCEELMAEMDKVKQASLAASGVWTGRGSGMRWGASLPYEDRWNMLPK
jgi:hypothetical protein